MSEIVCFSGNLAGFGWVRKLSFVYFRENQLVLRNIKNRYIFVDIIIPLFFSLIVYLHVETLCRVLLRSFSQHTCFTLDHQVSRWMLPRVFMVNGTKEAKIFHFQRALHSHTSGSTWIWSTMYEIIHNTTIYVWFAHLRNSAGLLCCNVANFRSCSLSSLWKVNIFYTMEQLLSNSKPLRELVRCLSWRKVCASSEKTQKVMISLETPEIQRCEQDTWVPKWN